jgi:hypothetical protein
MGVYGVGHKGDKISREAGLTIDVHLGTEELTPSERGLGIRIDTLHILLQAQAHLCPRLHLWVSYVVTIVGSW